MSKPYLRQDLDERFQLKQRKEGCLGLWGATIYRGTHQGRTVDFKPYAFYATGQSEGGPAIEMRVTLPAQCLPILHQMEPWYIHRWLASLNPPQNDLIAKSHSLTEIWRVKNTQLSLTIVNDRGMLDLELVPDCVRRLVAVADVIEAYSMKGNGSA